MEDEDYAGARMKDFLARRERGALLMSKEALHDSIARRPVLLSSSGDGFLHYGAAIQIMCEGVEGLLRSDPWTSLVPGSDESSVFATNDGSSGHPVAGKTFIVCGGTGVVRYGDSVVRLH